MFFFYFVLVLVLSTYPPAEPWPHQYPGLLRLRCSERRITGVVNKVLALSLLLLLLLLCPEPNYSPPAVTEPRVQAVFFFPPPPSFLSLCSLGAERYLLQKRERGSKCQQQNAGFICLHSNAGAESQSGKVLPAFV